MIDHTESYLNYKLVPPQKEDEMTEAPSRLSRTTKIKSGTKPKTR
jgi:hypothetical protein